MFLRRSLSAVRSVGSAAPRRGLSELRFRMPAEVAKEAQVSERARRVLTLDTASQKEIVSARVAEAIARFGYEPGDTGSSAAQIAILSVRIQALRDHLNANPRDKNNKRSLILLVNKRRRHMKYLRRVDAPKYHEVMKGLGLH